MSDRYTATRAKRIAGRVRVPSLSIATELHRRVMRESPTPIPLRSLGPAMPWPSSATMTRRSVGPECGVEADLSASVVGIGVHDRVRDGLGDGKRDRVVDLQRPLGACEGEERRTPGDPMHHARLSLPDGVSSMTRGLRGRCRAVSPQGEH
jgi:hypothetical protein